MYCMALRLISSTLLTVNVVSIKTLLTHIVIVKTNKFTKEYRNEKLFLKLWLDMISVLYTLTPDTGGGGGVVGTLTDNLHNTV
jgi:hypothetical protein